jgi:tetratricopeptide (TPR) repeat protein
MADTPRIEDLKRRVLSDPASIAFAALAEEFRRAGRFEEAIAACTAGLVRHPAYLSAHVTLGRALIEVSRYEDAREELEHVLRLAPENLAAIRGLAEIHHRRGDDGHEEYTDADAERFAAEGDATRAAEAALVEEAAPIALPSAAEYAFPGAEVIAVAHVEPPAAVAPAELRPAVAPAELRPAMPPAEVRAAVALLELGPAVAPAEPRAAAAEALPEAAAAPRHVRVDPALAGLEEFLHAVVRTRIERSAIR